MTTTDTSIVQAFRLSTHTCARMTCSVLHPHKSELCAAHPYAHPRLCMYAYTSCACRISIDMMKERERENEEIANCIRLYKRHIIYVL